MAYTDEQIKHYIEINNFKQETPEDESLSYNVGIVRMKNFMLNQVFTTVKIVIHLMVMLLQLVILT